MCFVLILENLPGNKAHGHRNSKTQIAELKIANKPITGLGDVLIAL